MERKIMILSIFIWSVIVISILSLSLIRSSNTINSEKGIIKEYKFDTLNTNRNYE